MKYISYYLSWVLPVYLFSVFFDLGLSGFLAWYYYEMKLPEITPRLYLLVWIGCMVLICMFMYMFINGVAKKHYSERHDYPKTTFIISQYAATITYVLITVMAKFEGMLCFPSVYLAFVINEFNPDIITDANQEVWTAVFVLFHAIIFTAVGACAYLKERKRLVDKYERAMRTDE